MKYIYKTKVKWKSYMYY